MTGPDDEFEDFLKRRKPKFRASDDLFEPPAELDRLVLRQAREAIESERPMKFFHGPRWAAPVALAATLLLAVTIIFQAGMQTKPAAIPEVTVQSAAERVDIADSEVPMPPPPAAAANNKARADAAGDAAPGVATVDLSSPRMARSDAAAGAASPASVPPLVSNDEAARYAPPPPSTAPVAAARPAESMASAPVVMSAPAATSTEVPTWRHDPKTWMAEIERLRNAGDTARADAELAEFNRQQRAYAVGPDR